MRLLPKPFNHPKGSRPWGENKCVFEWFLWILRTGDRWRDLPDK